MSRPTFATALILLGALLAVSCGNDTAPTTPTPPAVSVTESFKNQPDAPLTRNGGIVHTFVVSRAGTVSATITSLSPNSAAVVGLAIGTWNGSSCAVTIVKTDATTSTSVVGSTTSGGNFCVYIYDASGQLAQPTEYELSVTHF